MEGVHKEAAPSRVRREGADAVRLHPLHPVLPLRPPGSLARQVVRIRVGGRAERNRWLRTLPHSDDSTSVAREQEVAVQVKGEAVQVVRVTRQLLNNLVSSSSLPSSTTPEPDHSVKSCSGEQCRGCRVELGGVHVAGVGELLLRPGEDDEMLVMIIMVMMMMRMVVVKKELLFLPSGKRPHPHGSVSHCSGKLPLTVPDVCFDL